MIQGQEQLGKKGEGGGQLGPTETPHDDDHAPPERYFPLNMAGVQDRVLVAQLSMACTFALCLLVVWISL